MATCRLLSTRICSCHLLHRPNLFRVSQKPVVPIFAACLPQPGQGCQCSFIGSRRRHGAGQPRHLHRSLSHSSSPRRMPPVTASGFEVAFFPEKYPDVKVAGADPFSEASDLLVYAIPEDAFETDKTDKQAPAMLGGKLAKLDSAHFGGLLAALADANDFKGKEGSVAVGPWIGGKSKLVALVGLGPRKALPLSAVKVMQEVGKQLAATAKSTKAKTARFAVCGTAGSNALQAAGAQAFASGVLLGGYEATRFKAKAPKSLLETVFVHGSDAAGEEKLQAGVAHAKGTLLARYLVEAPPNICTPTHIANAAAEVQRAAPDVFTLEVLEKEQCKELGMGLYLGVAECSEEAPKFVHLTYKSPGDGERKVIGLVGKGLTFDSGGYNLKVGGSMIELMKFDMGGAAAVLGAAHTLGFLKPKGLEVHIITASCENMIAGHGLRPGDILTGASGKTVEVNNTDAEGRLTLADALWYAQEKCHVSKVVDIATLTGSCMVALGLHVAGLFSPSDGLRSDLQAASAAAGEKVWPMPLEESYWPIMKSPIADMKNAGSRYAGSITAGLFLKQYVDTEEVEWAHLDIAGPAWDEKQAQATGFGASLLASWVVGEAGKAAVVQNGGK